MTKPIIYFDECWQQTFWIFKEWPLTQTQKYLQKQGWDVHWEGYQGRTMWNTNGSGPIVIWTSPQKNPSSRAAILAHECIHAAGICLQRAGVISSFDNDEPLCYLTTILIRKALGGLNG